MIFFFVLIVYITFIFYCVRTQINGVCCHVCVYVCVYKCACVCVYYKIYKFLIYARKKHKKSVNCKVQLAK